MERLEGESGGTPPAPSGLLRLLRSVPPAILLNLTLILVLALAAVGAQFLAPYGHTDLNLRARLQPPVFVGVSSDYLLGTDHLGRDMLSRILIGLRTSLMIAALGTVIGLLVGSALGLLSGMGSTTVDNVVMFFVDTQLAIPFTLVALVAIAMFGTSLTVLIPIVGLAGWSTYARVTRGQVLVTRELPFIEAVRALGGSQLRVGLRHVLPNVLSPLIVLATYNFSQIMLLESALSFLGLGVQPPQTSLGALVGAGRNHLIGAWWVALLPAAVLVTITMSISLIGDWLRDVLDPNLKI